MPETPADTIRRAAQLMRERATAASPGPWHIGNAVDPTTPCNVHTFPGAQDVADNVGWLDAEHIAAMHPGVALAVAAWLDTWHPYGLTDETVADDWAEEYQHALAVSRAYLGEAT